MKKIVFGAAIAAACLSGITTSCITVYEGGDSGRVHKQTNVPEQKRTIIGGELQDYALDISSEFSTIVSAVPVDIVFTQGENFQANALLPKGLYDIMKVKVENGSLVLSLPEGNYSFDKSSFHGKTPTIFITNRTLARVSINGSGDLTINGPLKADSGVTFALAGSGDFTAEKIIAPQAGVTVRVAGAGDTNIGTIQAKSFAADIAGAGDMKCNGLDVAVCRIAISGAGDAKVGGRSNTVNLSVSGAGSINATGLSATAGNANVSGVGSIKCNVENLVKSVSGIGKISNKSPKK